MSSGAPSSGIVYAVVAGPGGVILAESSKGEGNFKSIAEQMLEKINFQMDSKKSYVFQGCALQRARSLREFLDLSLSRPDPFPSLAVICPGLASFFASN